jgi:hypothetical protein
MLSGGCERNTEGHAMKQIGDVRASAWKALEGQKIYFGHQSVGENILAGAADILARHPEIRLNIVAVGDPPKIDGPTLAHGRVGENRNPKSKIETFKKLMEDGLADQVDMAFFKFCYVDVSKETDVDDLFRVYRTTMEKLMKEYPDTMFLHVTVPLVSKESTLRTVAKKILGKTVRPYEENAARTAFNDRMRAVYGAGGRLFDLAKIESTRKDGSRLTYASGDDLIFALVPGYTDDGGHLNEAGRKLVGEQFLLFLSGVMEE